ncbi:MAG TPA: hypothetical protein VEG64_15155 [Candidatus Sulfotelmatobacter sp.]|nr:hypothetical protein [Candidatus Sulfotelmatobacter sp.]
MKRNYGAILAGVLCAALSACGGGGGIVVPPILNLSTQAVLFGAFVSAGKNPTPAAVNVSNIGGGALNFTAMSDQPWLMVAPANGTAPAALQISAALGALTPNTYIGHITVTANGAQGSPGIVTVTFTVGSGQASNAAFWAQWGANPQHTGMVSVTGQSLTNNLADIVYDPFVNQEKAENTPLYGAPVLTVHEQAPLTDGANGAANDVYMEMKSGTYNSCSPVGAWTSGAACGPNTWNTMWWNEVRFSWLNGQLLEVWDFESDWVPPPNATNFSIGQAGLEGWEPVFHPVEANGFIYVPGAGGTLHKVNKTTGAAASLINPFSNVAGVTNANTFVTSPLTADSSGNIYYNVVELNVSGGNPWGTDVVNAWLVKVASDDSFSMATYANLTPGAPLGTAQNCPGTFFNATPVPAFPWPPSTTAVAPSNQPCGSQRPPMNIAPVIAPNGTLYTASRAHLDSLVSYVIAVNPATMAVIWDALLENRLNDGCGVLVPNAPQGNTTTANTCLFGSNTGVDPTTNALGSGFFPDQASSSPVALPDSSVLMGALDNYNFGRGHLFHFDASGNFVNTYNFGWDSTPAVYVHGNPSTFSVVIKDNHYDASSYCSVQGNPVCAPRSPGPYYITQMDANLNIQWQFQNTTIDADHPNGYEWCINMPAVDMNGNVYVNSEDGNIYELPQGNTGIFMMPTGKMFLNLALGAAYTPLSVGFDGKLYTQNNGQLFAVGSQ